MWGLAAVETVPLHAASGRWGSARELCSVAGLPHTHLPLLAAYPNRTAPLPPSPPAPAAPARRPAADRLAASAPPHRKVL